MLAWANLAQAFRVPTAVLDRVNPARILDLPNGMGVPPDQLAAVRREWVLFTGSFTVAAEKLLQFEKNHCGRREPPQPPAA
ncbi:hypothetical protein [Amycolatopsis sp. WGS_07]|uniref:hypothetical protein n=1 Tax=Amycolatopsis sp. WGS_07 TaxID=3076764 RepID=UPI0038731A8E